MNRLEQRPPHSLVHARRGTIQCEPLHPYFSALNLGVILSLTPTSDADDVSYVRHYPGMRTPGGGGVAMQRG